VATYYPAVYLAKKELVFKNILPNWKKCSRTGTDLLQLLVHTVETRIIIDRKMTLLKEMSLKHFSIKCFIRSKT
jgi:hypothetical protein